MPPWRRSVAAALVVVAAALVVTTSSSDRPIERFTVLYDGTSPATVEPSRATAGERMGHTIPTAAVRWTAVAWTLDARSAGAPLDLAVPIAVPVAFDALRRGPPPLPNA